jgi:hypothetical protein
VFRGSVAACWWARLIVESIDTDQSFLLGPRAHCASETMLISPGNRAKRQVGPGRSADVVTVRRAC